MAEGQQIQAGGASVPDADFLSEKYTIDTPENVTFGYEVAGIGSRFIGALLDTLILSVALFILNIVLIAALAAIETGEVNVLADSSEEPGWVAGLVFALYALLNFAIFWGYYIFFELLWNGQTPGKRVAKTRVVRADGNPVGVMEVLVRNLVRIVDFLPTGYGFGLITMFCNRHARRLGDFAAGTMVIKTGSEIDVTSFARPVETATVRDPARYGAPSEGFSTSTRDSDPLWQRFPNIHQLSVADYELLSETLTRYRQFQVDVTILHRLAAVLARKLENVEPRRNDSYQFLADVAEAYRRYG